MTLLQYTVPSTQGSFYLHTEHIYSSLLRDEIITNCVLFAIIDFQLFPFSFYSFSLFLNPYCICLPPFPFNDVFCLPETIITAFKIVSPF